MVALTQIFQQKMNQLSGIVSANNQLVRRRTQVGKMISEIMSQKGFLKEIIGQL